MLKNISKKKIDFPIYSQSEIFKCAKTLFLRNWSGEAILLIGIVVGEIKSKFDIKIQTSIFKKEYHVNAIDNIINKINYKFKNLVLDKASNKLDKIIEDQKDTSLSKNNNSSFIKKYL